MSEHTELKIGTIDAIRVIMSSLDFENPDNEDNYEVVKILFRHKYIHVFICEYGNIYWNIKFSKSLIEGIKNWLKRKQEYENNN